MLKLKKLILIDDNTGKFPLNELLVSVSPTEFVNFGFPVTVTKCHIYV